MRVYSKDAGTIVLAAKDDSFAIGLPSNPSTGYQWQLQRLDKRYLSLLDHVYDTAAPIAMLGVTGEERFVFACVDDSVMFNTELVLSYTRAWENIAIDTKRFRVLKQHS